MNVSERWVFLFILLNIFFFQGLNRIGFGALLDVNFRLVDNQRIFLDELNEVKEAINIEDVALLTITAYSATKNQCDSDPNMTASMRPPKPGTIAVSRDLFKDGWVFGKKVYIEGKGIFEVNDLMNARLKKQIDIFMPTTKMALNFGKKELHAMLLKI